MSARSPARAWASARLVGPLRGRRVRRTRVGSDLPVLVVCRDRVAALTRLLAWLEVEGLRRVVLVDNDSAYPPMLRLLEETRHQVVRLGANVGHNAPWEAGLVDRFAPAGPYVVTDPDVVPADSAHGAVRRFARLLDRHPGHVKAGFGLRLDDLPASYDLRDEVRAWEAGCWEHEVEPDVWSAPIDTTFALYRASVRAPVLGPALRTGGRDVARHDPWYADSAHPTEEDRFYRTRARPGSATWGNDRTGTDPRYRRPRP